MVRLATRRQQNLWTQLKNEWLPLRWPMTVKEHSTDKQWKKWDYGIWIDLVCKITAPGIMQKNTKMAVCSKVTIMNSISNVKWQKWQLIRLPVNTVPTLAWQSVKGKWARMMVPRICIVLTFPLLSGFSLARKNGQCATVLQQHQNFVFLVDFNYNIVICRNGQ